MTDSEQEVSITVGDRVDICPHGATNPNHAKGTVVDTDPRTPVPSADMVSVELDTPPKHCENPYITPVSSINEVLGDG